MIRRPTHIIQPGLPQEPRIVAVEAAGKRVQITLRRGDNLLVALSSGLAARGFRGGVANFQGLKLSPFAYVFPALSPDGANIAWYSAAERPAGVSVVESGAITIGTKAGAPFYHCHAIWREADGTRAGGHMLPEQTFVAEDAVMDVLAMDGAFFDARYDSETNFTLLAPVAAPPTDVACDRRVIALRLRPNQDVIGAIEAAAAAAGLKRGAIAGGVGSCIGLALSDGHVVENFATEVFVRRGALAPGASGTLRADVDFGLVDLTRTLAEGRILPKVNPVLITFELVLETDEP